MSASFHNSQQEITKLGNFMNCQIFCQKCRNSREFPPGIFEAADSREFPNGNSRWPCIELASLYTVPLAPLIV